MSSSTVWILVVIAAVACLVLHRLVLRVARRRQAAPPRAKHAELDNVGSAQAEQTKKRIEQLQAELANARRQRKDQNESRATLSSTMQALSRELDRAADSKLPADGFADTQPWPQS